MKKIWLRQIRARAPTNFSCQFRHIIRQCFAVVQSSTAKRTRDETLHWLLVEARLQDLREIESFILDRACDQKKTLQICSSIYVQVFLKAGCDWQWRTYIDLENVKGVINNLIESRQAILLNFCRKSRRPRLKLKSSWEDVTSAKHHFRRLDEVD